MFTNTPGAAIPSEITTKAMTLGKRPYQPPSTIANVAPQELNQPGQKAMS